MVLVSPELHKPCSGEGASPGARQDPGRAGCALRHPPAPASPARAVLCSGSTAFGATCSPLTAGFKLAMGHTSTNRRGSEARVPRCPLRKVARAQLTRKDQPGTDAATTGASHAPLGGDFFPVRGDFSLPFGRSSSSERRRLEFPKHRAPRGRRPGPRLRALPL